MDAKPVGTKMLTAKLVYVLATLCILSGPLLAQDQSAVAESRISLLSQAQIDQVSQLLGLTDTLRRLQLIHVREKCEAQAGSLEELALRQSMLESIQAASLDVDSAVGVIANERGKLSNLEEALKARRDHITAKLNAASLITGAGVGATVSATQFTTLGSRSNNIGDGIGVGSGVTSTVLAYLAVRKQRGPEGRVSEITNMLAPLFDQTLSPNTFYPEVVLEYLQLVPPGPTSGFGTRLQQLKAEWIESGRLESSDASRYQNEIAALTTGGGDEGLKVSIEDLSNRIAMLGDVSGRIALMKRDLSLLMRSYMTPTSCSVH